MKTSVDFGILSWLVGATDEAMRVVNSTTDSTGLVKLHEGVFDQGDLTGSTRRTPIASLSQWAGDVSVVPGLSTTVEQLAAHGSAEQVSARGLREQVAAPSVDGCAGSVVQVSAHPPGADSTSVHAVARNARETEQVAARESGSGYQLGRAGCCSPGISCGETEQVAARTEQVAARTNNSRDAEQFSARTPGVRVAEQPAARTPPDNFHQEKESGSSVVSPPPDQGLLTSTAVEHRQFSSSGDLSSITRALIFGDFTTATPYEAACGDIFKSFVDTSL